MLIMIAELYITSGGAKACAPAFTTNWPDSAPGLATANATVRRGVRDVDTMSTGGPGDVAASLMVQP